MTELTRDQIHAMPASREMDALIAERVMGHSVKRNASLFSRRQVFQGTSEGFVELHHYSIDDAAALAAFTSTHRAVSLTRVRPNLWEASMIDVSPIIIAEAETAPLAICRMLLLAGLDKA